MLVPNILISIHTITMYVPNISCMTKNMYACSKHFRDGIPTENYTCPRPALLSIRYKEGTRRRAPKKRSNSKVLYFPMLWFFANTLSKILRVLKCCRCHCIRIYSGFCKHTECEVWEHIASQILAVVFQSASFLFSCTCKAENQTSSSLSLTQIAHARCD